MNKFQASWELTKGSVKLLRREKEIVLFPIFSVATILIVVTIFFMIFIGSYFEFDINAFLNYVQLNDGFESSVFIEDLILWGSIFTLYLLVSFISLFFQAGLITLTQACLENKDLSFRDGINAAQAKSLKLLKWSLVSATVGILLSFIVSKFEKIGEVVASTLGAGWEIVTYFIAPILTLENFSIKNSLQQSGLVIKNTWGEVLITGVSVSLIGTLTIFIPSLVLFLSFISNSQTLYVSALVLLILWIIVVTVINSALNGILRVVIYNYATQGILPNDFSPELVNMLFKNK